MPVCVCECARDHDYLKTQAPIWFIYLTLKLYIWTESRTLPNKYFLGFAKI